MGGSKNKSPAQKEKSQKKDTTKKSKKTEKGADSKTKLSPASLPEISVPSISKEPSITETNPLAAFVLVSVVVNVSVSPSL